MVLIKRPVSNRADKVICTGAHVSKLVTPPKGSLVITIYSFYPHTRARASTHRGPFRLFRHKTIWSIVVLTEYIVVRTTRLRLAGSYTDRTDDSNPCTLRTSCHVLLLLFYRFEVSSDAHETNSFPGRRRIRVSYRSGTRRERQSERALR